MDALALTAALLAGCLLGRILRGSAGIAALNRRLSSASLWGLLVAMGAGLAQERASLSGGTGAVLLAVGSAVLLTAVFFALFLAAGAWPRSKKARPGAVAQGPLREAPRGAGGQELLAVGASAGCVFFGFLLFGLLPPGWSASLPLGPAAAWLLGALLLTTGFGLGAELHRLDPRLMTRWMLLAPFINIAVSLLSGLLLGALAHPQIGTLAGPHPQLGALAGPHPQLGALAGPHPQLGALAGSYPQLGARGGALLTAGMGWYSLSSAMLAERGMAALSLLAFAHNAARELLAILCAPLAARVSPLLPIYLGGATSMDVMLPFVKRYSGGEYALASFYSGAVCSMVVAPLVNAVAGG
jgi:uncharacterized membrane protein YbjE (DUF340 family)